MIPGCTINDPNTIYKWADANNMAFNSNKYSPHQIKSINKIEQVQRSITR